MRPQLPEHALIILLRQCFLTPRCQLSNCRPLGTWSKSLHNGNRAQLLPSSIEGRQRGFNAHDGTSNSLRKYSSSVDLPNSSNNALRMKAQKATRSAILNQPHETTEKIAVLGGGITGLATAHYLARELPHAHITLYEGSDRLGGWVKSQQVKLKQGDVVFEQGPRNLRPASVASLVTLDMIQHLNLEDKLLLTPNYSVAARNRFIYYPDRLVKMPGPGQDLITMLWSVISEPVFKGLVLASIMEFRSPKRSTELQDESIGSFLDRRLGRSEPTNNIVSAVLHGIYAGDVYQLSAKSLLSALWQHEGSEGSITDGFWRGMREGIKNIPAKDALLIQSLREVIPKALMDKMERVSVFTFKGGLETLSDALAESLKKNPKVVIKMNQNIQSIEYDGAAEGIKIKTSSNHPSMPYAHCISTIPAHSLASLTPYLPTLNEIPSVTVMVVNLFYTNPGVLPEAGFGYLIPRSIPFEQNPECALGVVFDSYSCFGQDTVSGTKLTVMLGGHWWDSFSSYPTEEEGVQMAKNLLKRHLYIDDEPEKAVATLQRKCIPQYTVGHEGRLKKAHFELKTEFKGKLSVAGNWIDGVGLNDCVRGARDVVMSLAEENGLNGSGTTGLEDFQRERVWVQAKLDRKRLEEQAEAMRREVNKD